MSECSHEPFPGPTSRGTARMSDPEGAHLMSWHRTNASGAYSVWMAQVITRYSDHFPLCNVCPVCGTPFPRPKTRKLRVYLGTYQVLATQGHPQRSERACAVRRQQAFIECFKTRRQATESSTQSASCPIGNHDQD